jgi:hypothetical protein
VKRKGKRGGYSSTRTANHEENDVIDATSNVENDKKLSPDGGENASPVSTEPGLPGLVG